MNKRQRKKYAKKHASAPCRALIDSCRAMLRRETLVSETMVNNAWRKFHNYLRDIQAMEIERIERGPMPWIGYQQPSGDFSNASGTQTEGD